MALIKCKECGNEVSSAAKTCPKCGAQVAKEFGCLPLLGVLLALSFVIAIGNAITGSTDQPTKQQPARALPTPIKCPTTVDIERPNSSGHQFQAKFQAAAQGNPLKPIIVGKTNLPTGTKLIVALERDASDYKAQAEAVVGLTGCFNAGPFTQSGAEINPGEYTIDVLMPVSSGQPIAVQQIIGHSGENISGPLVRKFEHFGKLVEYKASLKVGVADAQKDTQAKQKVESEAKEEQSKLRLAMVLLMARTLKENLRNPSSADWVRVLANDDASVVCIVLRAQNGFGGMTVDDYAIVNGKVSESAGVWNKYCAGKTMNDLTSTVRWGL